MKLKTKLLFTLLLFTALCGNKMIAQEAAQDPIDTLARAVNSINDELSKIKRLKITGYIQPQWQYIDSAGASSVAGGDFKNGTNPYFSRFTMRRGRFKFTYELKNTKLVINTDITEKGLFMRETYAKVTDPWLKMFSLTAGLLQDQFGFEITQSSSDRETPERARMIQTLFPVERDLGAFFTMEMPKTSPLAGLKIDLAAMNGAAGVTPEFDSHKDFSGRMQYTHTTKNEKVSFGVGASYYYGGYRIGSNKDYNLQGLTNGDQGYVISNDSANVNRVAKRNYMGADAQVNIDWKAGITILRAEFITGEQPGTDASSKSPIAAPSAALYHRSFNGCYFYLIQNIGHSKFQAVAKYDWYDPNTKISGKEIGKAGTKTTSGDVRYDTYGFGLTYKISANLKVIGYYDYVINEKTLLAGYYRDIPDNVVTLRMQFKF